MRCLKAKGYLSIGHLVRHSAAPRDANNHLPPFTLKTVKRNLQSLLGRSLASLRFEHITAFWTFERLIQLVSKNFNLPLTGRTDDFNLIQLFVALKSWTMLVCHSAPPSFVNLPLITISINTFLTRLSSA